MAIDTAAKRASALSFFQLGCLLPIPDGTIGQGDRQHLAGFYSGILAGIAPAAVGAAVGYLYRGNLPGILGRVG